MKKQYNKVLGLCISFCLVIGAGDASAQLSGWSYKLKVDVFNKSSVPKSNYAEFVVVDTRSLINAGIMQSSGADIRLADSCSNNANILSHYIYSGINTDSTKIWVKIPSISANSMKSVYMFYGNSSASSTSSFGSVFSSVFKTGGPNYTLGDTVKYDWFEVEANDTVFVTAGKTLTIRARVIIIKGAIVGSYSGYIPSSLNSVGGGTAGGGTSTNAGSGGGGYGGDGGTGGYDAGDSPGAGGTAYGTSSGLDIAMGSAGGSSDLVLGGKSGTAIDIQADYFELNGAIHNNGGDGAGLQARNGGGGSGGGTLVRARFMWLAGKLTATGGNGGVGTSTANDDGGGGGGGRIKLFYSAYISGGVTTQLGGGTGGPNGTASGGINGGTGSFFKGFKYTNFDSIVVNVFKLKLSDPDGEICDGMPLTVTVPAGYSLYEYYLNGNKKSSGTSNQYTFTKLVNSDSLGVMAYVGACYSAKGGIKIKVDPNPLVVISIPDTSLCLGDTAFMKATGAKTYVWLGGPKTDIYKPVPTAAKTYTVVGTDAKGCIDTTSQTVTVNDYPSSVSISGVDKICFKDSTVLVASGASHYDWSTGETTDSIVVKPSSSKDYTVWGYEHPDCRLLAGYTVTVLPLPAVYISGKTHLCKGDSIILAANNAVFYTWITGSHALSETFRPTKTTTYWLVGKDDNGCKDTAFKTLSIDTLPIINISGDNEICEGESTQLSVSGASTYKWMNGSTKTSITYTPASTSTVTVVGTDGNNCRDTGKYNVVVHSKPTVTLIFPAFLDTVCLHDADWTLAGGAPAGGVYKGYGVNAGKFSATVTGVGKFKIRYVFSDAYTCSDSADRSIFVDECLGVYDVNLDPWISVYPNPVISKAEIKVEFAGNFAITDCLGRCLQRFSLQKGQTKEVDMQNWPNGMYFIRPLDVTHSNGFKILLNR